MRHGGNLQTHHSVGVSMNLKTTNNVIHRNKRLGRQGEEGDAPRSGDINYSSSHGDSHILISWFLSL